MKRLGKTMRTTAALSAAATACVTPELRVVTPELRALADGRYEGYVDGGLVKAAVAVEMRSGAIVAVEILEHECGLGKPAERVAADVVARQSLEVDAVAGATYSSRVILKAVETALAGAAR